MSRGNGEGRPCACEALGYVRIAALPWSRGTTYSLLRAGRLRGRRLDGVGIVLVSVESARALIEGSPEWEPPDTEAGP